MIIHESQDPPSGEILRVLTVYLVLLLALPSTMVISALGFIGGPAIVLGVAVFVVGFLQFLSRSSPVPRGSAVDLGIKAMLVVQLLAYSHSAWLPLPPDERTVADAALISVVSCSAIGLAASRLTAQRDLSRFCTRISVAIGALALLGLLQLVTGQIFVDLLSIPGLSPPVLEGLHTRGSGIRPSGTSTNALEYASLMVMALPLVLVVAGTAKSRRPLYISIAALVSLVILLSGSRTSLVCGLVAFVALLPAWSKGTRLAAAAALVAGTAALFVVRPGFIGSVGELFLGASDDPGVLSRTNSYEVVWRYASTHPWLGRGPGTFLPKYWIVDNQYLQSLLGAGVVGLVALIGLVATAVVASSRAAHRASNPVDRQIAVAIRAGLLAGATSFAFFDSFSFTQAIGFFYLMLGLAGAVDVATTRSPALHLDTMAVTRF